MARLKQQSLRVVTVLVEINYRFTPLKAILPKLLVLVVLADPSASTVWAIFGSPLAWLVAVARAAAASAVILMKECYIRVDVRVDVVLLTPSTKSTKWPKRGERLPFFTRHHGLVWAQQKNDDNQNAVTILSEDFEPCFEQPTNRGRYYRYYFYL